jgi:hypothetical protein
MPDHSSGAPLPNGRASISELRTSERLLDNSTWSLLGLTENETSLLLTLLMLTDFSLFKRREAVPILQA